MTRADIDLIRGIQRELDAAEGVEADMLRAKLAGASYRLVDEVEFLWLHLGMQPV